MQATGGITYARSSLESANWIGLSWAIHVAGLLTLLSGVADAVLMTEAGKRPRTALALQQF
jgi:hypothetical protein